MTAPAEDDIVLRLLHTADWHLGKRFPSFRDDLEVKLTRARLDVLDRVFGLAAHHAVHAVLCAGDLFDDPTPLPQWWEELARRLKKHDWRGRPVFLLPGNHDPLLPESIWAKGHPFRSLLPEGVHVVDDDAFAYELPGNAVLHAVPCRSKAGQGDPTERLPPRAAGDERIRIGMVHGSTFDVKGCQTNFPISRDAALTCGLDYLAIGDTHGFRFVPADRLDQPTIYPGTPEPTAFDEEDPGKVAVVLFNRRRRVSVRAERVAYWTWQERTVTSLSQLRELRDAPDLERCVLRVHVEMRVSPPEYDEAERLLEDLQGTPAKHGRVGVLDLHRSGLELETSDIDAYCTDLPDVLQAAVRRLKAAAADPQQTAVAQRALYHLYRTSKKAS